MALTGPSKQPTQVANSHFEVERPSHSPDNETLKQRDSPAREHKATARNEGENVTPDQAYAQLVENSLPSRAIGGVNIPPQWEKRSLEAAEAQRILADKLNFFEPRYAKIVEYPTTDVPEALKKNLSSPSGPKDSLKRYSKYTLTQRKLGNISITSPAKDQLEKITPLAMGEPGARATDRYYLAGDLSFQLAVQHRLGGNRYFKASQPVQITNGAWVLYEGELRPVVCHSSLILAGAELVEEAGEMITSLNLQPPEPLLALGNWAFPGADDGIDDPFGADEEKLFGSAPAEQQAWPMNRPNLRSDSDLPRNTPRISCLGFEIRHLPEKPGATALDLVLNNDPAIVRTGGKRESTQDAFRISPRRCEAVKRKHQDVEDEEATIVWQIGDVISDKFELEGARRIMLYIDHDIGEMQTKTLLSGDGALQRKVTAYYSNGRRPISRKGEELLLGRATTYSSEGRRLTPRKSDDLLLGRATTYSSKGRRLTPRKGDDLLLEKGNDVIFEAAINYLSEGRRRTLSRPKKITKSLASILKMKVFTILADDKVMSMGDRFDRADTTDNGTTDLDLPETTLDEFILSNRDRKVVVYIDRANELPQDLLTALINVDLGHCRRPTPDHAYLPAKQVHNVAWVLDLDWGIDSITSLCGWSAVDLKPHTTREKVGAVVDAVKTDLLQEGEVS
ncbi:MAG: hypothetical protein M1828_006398 [Chrysothrix sp. TS-e1954]|nr:MAG: hypothetical protein M1828_006398 [Chrysothrix sp. TS-e1954]